MFCRNCGQQLPDNAKFCEECGAVLTAPQAPPPQTYAPPAPQAAPQSDLKESLTQAAQSAKEAGIAVYEAAKPKVQAAVTAAKEKADELLHKNTPQTVTCPGCGAVFPPDGQFCRSCGTPRPAQAVKTAAKPQNDGRAPVGVRVLFLVSILVMLASFITFYVFGAKDCGYVTYDYNTYSVGSVLDPDRYEISSWGKYVGTSESEIKQLNSRCREARFEGGGIGMLVCVGTGLIGLVLFGVAFKKSGVIEETAASLAAKAGETAGDA
jgi:predicted amidophosphoribosyltransferase